MYQLIRGALKNPTDRTKLTLVFGVNTEHDLVLRDELDAFQKKYPDRFDVVYTVTAPKGEISAPLRTGRVTEALLREVMGENAKGGRGEGGGVKVLVCGPPGMETALLGESGWLWGKKSEGILGRLGFEKGEVYKF